MLTENMMLCTYLGVCSCYDCRERRIPVWLLYAGTIMGALYAIGALAAGRVSPAEVLAGISPAGVMMLYSRLTEGKLGGADGWMVLPAGLLHGWELCTAEIITACMLTFTAAIFMITAKKAARNTKIPFAPFLLAAVAALWIAGSMWRM